jgi:trk system potassium uptake protein TrkH
MRAYLMNLPLPIVLLFAAGLAMFVPAIVGSVQDHHNTARVFFYAGILVLVVAGLIGFAMQTGRREATARNHLVTLLLAYLWLPLILAIPMDEAVGNTRFINVYFDMVSALTTTGAKVFEVARLDPAVHLWRGLVGWLGGLMIWITAVAVLAPLNLGGWEVTSEAQVPGQVVIGGAQMRAALPSERLRRNALRLTPIYAGLTLVLAVLLIASGTPPLVATIHAMSTLATSGITPLASFEGQPAGVLGEALIFLFFIFALSRLSFASGFGVDLPGRLAKDREIRIALFAVIVVPTLLFARHWIGALEVDELSDGTAGLTALWGGIFTVLSFLTTTGFVSESWADARSWSGLPTPGMILIGLVLMGGGVATTAGGVKLLRVYALYKHGMREMGKLTHPHSVANAGRLGRRIRREGAYIAWIFFMLFILAMAATMVALSLTGIGFERAMVLAIAALTTTGPLAEVAGEDPISYFLLSDAAKLILAAAMIVGRMETLVLIALFNPAFWRN